MTTSLVTGGAGFIGTHLVRRLTELGHDVLVLDNLNRAHPPSLPRGGRCRFVHGDVRDAATMRSVTRGRDLVFHLAAQSNVMGALEDPEYSFGTNAYGTFNVLRSAVEEGARRVIFTSSREAYGEPQYTPVDEDHPLNAKNPYGASKVSGEVYCRTFAHCHGLDVAIVRLANVYGPGDKDRVIPLWLTEAVNGRDLKVFGGNQILDFVWIDTVVDALVYAGEHGLPGPTNIGSGIGTSILELAERVLETTRSSSQVMRTPARSAEVTRFVADVTRMRSLGLQPEHDPLAHLGEMVENQRIPVRLSR